MCALTGAGTFLPALIMNQLRSIPERKDVIAVDDRPFQGHQLATISERVPGREPTDASIDLTHGATYEARYYRCLRCGQERNRRDDFRQRCAASGTLARTDGGYSVTDTRTSSALGEKMVIEPRTEDSVFRVMGESGITHRVDLVEETCTCLDHRRHRAFCKHLRRVDIELRIGTLPHADD